MKRLYLLAFGESKTFIQWSRDKRCVVNYTTLLKRLNRGWDTEAALTSSGNTGPKRRSARRSSTRTAVYLLAFGEEKTKTQWSRDERCVVSYITLSKRLNRGWDTEAALTAPIGQFKTYIAFGEEKTARSWSRDKRCVVSYTALLKRLNCGWDTEAALTRSPM